MSNNIFDNESENESYNSYDYSEDESEHESEVDDLIYEPEENSLTKYNIVLCELYNKDYHGYFDGEINEHYLALTRFKKYDNNYINIYRRNNPLRFKIEIAECLYLPSSHCVSILKTHWLKLVQRTWKKIYKHRKQTLLLRSHPNSLKYREIHGRWPNSCSNYPILKGMLSYLSR
jgi:hypothetical protein